MKLTIVYNKTKKINFLLDKEYEDRQIPNIASKKMKERLPEIKEWKVLKWQ